MGDAGQCVHPADPCTMVRQSGNLGCRLFFRHALLKLGKLQLELLDQPGAALGGSARIMACAVARSEGSDSRSANMSLPSTTSAPHEVINLDRPPVRSSSRPSSER